VAEILAAREAKTAPPPLAPQEVETEREKAISAEVQARLDSIEKRLEGQEGERAEGLSYLFMAKQHQARGEDKDALKMYELAQPFFPGNEKLERKIEKLRIKVSEKVPEKQTASLDEHAKQGIEHVQEEVDSLNAKRRRKASNRGRGR